MSVCRLLLPAPLTSHAVDYRASAVQLLERMVAANVSWKCSPPPSPNVTHSRFRVQRVIQVCTSLLVRDYIDNIVVFKLV